MEQGKRIFRGLDEREEYHRVVTGVPGGTISPGGAAMLLGVSRQRIHALMDEGKVGAWVFYDDRSKTPEMIDVSLRDLVRHGVRTGRIRCHADMGFYSNRLAAELEGVLRERQLEVDANQPALVE